MIYLDNAATTKIDPRVLEAMMPYLTEEFGNPGTLYGSGRRAKEAVEKARTQVAKFLNAEPNQIIFTSGGTEANNMVFAMAQRHLSEAGRKHLVVSEVEHDSVIRPARNLAEARGFELTMLAPDRRGKVSPIYLKEALRDDTGLVSVMYVNNEIGVINDLRSHKMARRCHERGALFHTDCVQAAGCRPINVKNIDCDFATISSHKIYGPKGVGALYVKDKSKFNPMIFGGGSQEFGLRGGTENVAGIVGFGKACELLTGIDWISTVDHIEDVKSAFCGALCAALESYGIANCLEVNGRYSPYGAKVVNFRVDGVDAESLILLADSFGVCISAGSACNSKEQVPSHVLKAIGLTDDQARSSFRVSFSRMNTVEEASQAGEVMAKCIAILKGFA